MINEWNETGAEKKDIEDASAFEIAVCQLVFNNEKVLQLLVNRGYIMKKGDHVALDEINKKIQKIKNDKDSINLIRPNCVFITFLNREDKEFALKS